MERHTMSSPAVTRDLVFVADCGKNVYCVDRRTGQKLWSHEMKGEFWASPLVADGKVFIGSRRGDFCVFAASREKRLLNSADFGAPISATAVAANGRLYVSTMTHLFAIGR
jgi:outer membrane protein assembly factor BamB